MRTLVAISPSTLKNLALESPGLHVGGEPRALLIVEKLQHQDDGDQLIELSRFSLTIDRIDSLIGALTAHRAALTGLAG